MGNAAIFPCQYQGDDTRIAFSAFRNVVALEVKVEDEVLCSIKHLASLAEPVVAVVLCQPDDLGPDMVQEFLSLLFS